MLYVPAYKMGTIGKIVVNSTVLVQQGTLYLQKAGQNELPKSR
jgi:hypothetical protein